MKADWYDRLCRHPRLLPAAARAANGGAQIMGVLEQYRLTERLAPAELASQQRTLLLALAEHAAAESPLFARRLRAADLTLASLAEPGGWARLAPLTRREVVAAGDSLFCRTTPAAHGRVAATSTSGSTGEPVTVRRTQLCQLHWFAQTLREHLWHDRDFSARLAVLRANAAAGSQHPDWGSPSADVLRTGSVLVLLVSRPVEEILARLVEFQPGYLLILPSVLASLVELMERSGQPLAGLRGIRTLSETVSPDLRTDTRRVLDLEIDDAYSSQEGGVMAAQCPEGRRYHVAETLIMEVVNAAGKPCAPGEIGRILITDLLNFATPLIRYEIGDYAEAGAPNCPCGRGLPVIQRFRGRERNLVLLPDGSRHWPLVGFHRWQEVCPIRQFQFVQLDRQTIEVRLSSADQPTAAQEAGLTDILQQELGYPFAFRYRWQAEPLARGPGGKFEEFLCLAK